MENDRNYIKDNSLFFSYGLYILNYQFNLKKPTEDYISFEDLYIIMKTYI